ncbi:MAG: cyclic nucleotide-binding domain-containing protein [Spirochaetota bacterium]
MERSVVEKLKRIPLFADIVHSDEYMERLQAICWTKSVAGGKTVIQEGERGSEMYIMLSGRVEIRRRTRAGDDYTVTKLRAEDNVFFGEMALIDDDLRSATIVTTVDSEFLVVRKDDFIRLGDQHPQIALPITREIAKILASRLRKTTGDMLTIFDALVAELQA